MDQTPPDSIWINNNRVVTETPTDGLNKYREQLRLFRNEFSVQKMPDIKYGGISEHYPYITWARDHYFGRKNNPISNRDYPLTWEINASAADYPKMAAIDEKYVKENNSSPHTWHAAEIFLYLTDSTVFDSENNCRIGDFDFDGK